MPLGLGTDIVDRLALGTASLDRLYVGEGLAWTAGGIPTITSFTVAPARINRANLADYAHVTLSWQASGFSTLALYETAAAGTRTPVPFVSGDTSVTFRRPSESVTYTLEAGNAAGTAVAHADFAIVANASIAYFRTAAFQQTPHVGGGTIGSVTLEWQVAGEPFPRIRLVAGDNHGSFDSNDPPHRDHTDHATGIGSLRLSHGLGDQARPVTYTLTVSNEVNSVSRSLTFNWPVG